MEVLERWNGDGEWNEGTPFLREQLSYTTYCVAFAIE